MEAETQSDGRWGKTARDEEGWMESEGVNKEGWKGDSRGKQRLKNLGVDVGEN